MRLKKYSILLFIFLIPLNVEAYIICNDGTQSSSCQDCHQGCCSRHGGCTADAPQQSMPAPPQQSTPVPEPTPEPAPAQENSPIQSEEPQPAVEDSTLVEDNTTSDDAIQDEERITGTPAQVADSNENTVDESDGEEGAALLGLWVLGALGTSVYTVKKSLKNEKERKLYENRN